MERYILTIEGIDKQSEAYSARVPVKGEWILHDNVCYVVHSVTWMSQTKFDSLALRAWVIAVPKKKAADPD